MKTSNRRTARIGGGKTTSREATSREGSRFSTPISIQRSTSTEVLRRERSPIATQKSMNSSQISNGASNTMGSTYRRKIMGRTYNTRSPGTGYTGHDMLDGSGHTTENNRVFSDDTLLHPVWNKVTETPWTAGARVYAGYGRNVNDHTVSHEAPAHFHIPSVQHFERDSSIGYLAREAKRSQTAPTVRHDTAVSGDAPTWFHIDKVQKYDPKHSHENQPKFEKILVGRTVVLEPESLRSFSRRTANQNQSRHLYS